LKQASRVLDERGFAEDQTYDGCGYRCQRGDASVDLLMPEGVSGSHDNHRPERPGGRRRQPGADTGRKDLGPTRTAHRVRSAPQPPGRTGSQSRSSDRRHTRLLPPRRRRHRTASAGQQPVSATATYGHPTRPPAIAQSARHHATTPQLLAEHSQCRDSSESPHPPRDTTSHNLITVPPPSHLRTALSRHSVTKVRQETYVKPDPADTEMPHTTRQTTASHTSTLQVAITTGRSVIVITTNTSDWLPPDRPPTNFPTAQQP
jgi:hypothetical protein